MPNRYICLILGIVLLFKGLNGTICYQSQLSGDGSDKVRVECPPNTKGCLRVMIKNNDTGTFFTERQEDIRKGFLTKMLKCFIDCIINNGKSNVQSVKFIQNYICIFAFDHFLYLVLLFRNKIKNVGTMCFY